MLAEPMSLTAVAKPVGSDIVGADAASLPVHWLHEATEWPRTDDTAAVFIQRFSSGSMDLQITGHVEYDGFTRFDCKVKAREATGTLRVVPGDAGCPQPFGLCIRQ